MEDYHTDDLLSVGGIDAINEYGVQQPLFTDEKSVRRRIQVLVEVEDDADCKHDSTGLCRGVSVS